MGLDIDAYEIVTRLDPQPPEDEEGNYEAGDRYLFVERPERAVGVTSGYHRTSGQSHEFRAGSYSGYNAWRAELCRMAHDCSPETVWRHEETFAGKPFIELIHFSDCEGTIGPAESAKLAADFDAYEEQAKEYAASLGCEEGKWFLAKYADWHRAFSIAANTGAVAFH